jgi:hypothetical protein
MMPSILETTRTIDGIITVFPEANIAKRLTLHWPALRSALISGHATLIERKGHKTP